MTLESKNGTIVFSTYLFPATVAMLGDWTYFENVLEALSTRKDGAEYLWE